MKKQICAAISTITLFLPWTILVLRTFPWALESPAAEIVIYSYAAFMILSGIFAVFAYAIVKVKGKWMQICTVINVIYAAGAIGLLGLAFL